MTQKSNGGKFFLTGLLAAAAGAIGGLLFAPKSGKETREDLRKLAVKLNKEVKTNVTDTKTKVKEVFGEATEETVKKYNEIKSAVMGKIAEGKTAGKEIDKGKYALIVEDVVSEFKGDLRATKDGMTKLAAQLKKDWEKVKKALA